MPLETGPDEYDRFVMVVFAALTPERVWVRMPMRNKVRAAILAFTNPGHVPGTEREVASL